MENGKEIAAVILEQLGGSRFVAMTGSKNFGYTGASLRMDLARNSSGANRLTISLVNDLYNLKFYRLTIRAGRPVITTKQEFNGLGAEDLQRVFTEVTGLYTKF
jgi:hypothetical protein